MVSSEVEAEIDKVVARWRRDLNPYCLDCESYCCSDMIFIFSEDNLDELLKIVPHGRIPEQIKEPFEIRDGDICMVITPCTSGKYKVDFDGPCPNLDLETSRCLEYEDRLTPCKRYPLFYEAGVVYYFSDCPVLKEASNGWRHLPRVMVETIEKFNLGAVDALKEF